MMGNPNCSYNTASLTLTHAASEARSIMTVEEAADVRVAGGQRKPILHGYMRAKLLNYIGQVFECKADNAHNSRRSGETRSSSCFSRSFGLFGLFS